MRWRLKMRTPSDVNSWPELSGLRDGEAVAIRGVYPATDIYRGPYVGAAPDLIVGYAEGYRASWQAAVGKTAAAVFEDNTKAWCGDHCVDPHLVPGVLFSNRQMKAKTRELKTWRRRRFICSESPRPRGWKVSLLSSRPESLLARKEAVMPASAAAILALALLTGCGHSHHRKLIVIGVDGMDPGFVERHWADLPNLDRLRSEGSFQRLATTTPPQSPVAWSTFITGLDPARPRDLRFCASRPGHARAVSLNGPDCSTPFQPAARALPTAALESARRIPAAWKAFWQTLSERGVPVTIVRMPVNYPPLPYGDELAGMGTPDLRGTQGTFSFYTDDAAETSHAVAGGLIQQG